ncbi:hypothetical protein [Tamlana sp. s12]|nr:hypothetical protein [Tamlana sp. s12]
MNTLELDIVEESLGYNLFKYSYLTLFVFSLGGLLTNLVVNGF